MMAEGLSGFLRTFTRGLRIVPRKGWKTLDAKRAKKGYVKGKGVKSVGRHTKYGGYTILAHKIPRYIVPDLKGFELKPYVARNFKPFYKA
ncbi:ribosomal protein L27 [Chloropicon roscoffensis]|uniref:Ribosomal protein L27 n=1 Tax=Chloropicon roscoffensis TaxID=1461544 RepID=A0AAX4P4Z8_9CHLO